MPIPIVSTVDIRSLFCCLRDSFRSPNYNNLVIFLKLLFYMFCFPFCLLTVWLFSGMKSDDEVKPGSLSSLSHSRDGVIVVSNNSSASAAAEPDYAERDPQGRYVRYNERLGQGSFKTVYLAFDEIDGIEVAWNRVKTRDVFQSSEEFENVHVEVKLLKTLEHENIIKLYDSWIDGMTNTVNMITELFTSGSLSQYRKKHRNVDMKAIKNWASQILRGLDYLHSQNPPIIHRDLKCDNIFINGHSGEIKIGDLGLATVKEHSCARSIIGTPEFMAPELYEEQYNELVDIYSFGMCLLEMITCDYPYSECNGLAEIYKKVTSGIKPDSLGKINDPEMKKFIEKCLVPASERLPAKELLKDPFLQCGTQKHIVLDPLKLPHKIHRSLSSLFSGPNSMDINPDCNHSLYTESNSDGPFSPTVEFQRTHQNNEFRFRGAIEDENTVELNGQIVDSSVGQIWYLHFNFSLINDTAIDVAREMVEQLELEDDNVEFIADFISYMITRILPGWKPPSDYNSGGSGHSSPDTSSVVIADVPAPVANAWETVQNEHDQLSKSITDHKECWIEIKKSPSLAHYEDTQSQDSVPSEALFDGFYINNNNSDGFYAMDESGRDFFGYGSDMGFNDLHIDKLKFQGNESGVESIVINDSVKSLQFSSLDLQMMSSASCCSSPSSSDKIQDFELKLEIDKIEAQYQQCLQELMKRREEELKAARNKWIAKKNLIV